MLFAENAIGIFQLGVTLETSILVPVVPPAPESSRVSEFRMTDETLIFIAGVLLAIEAIGIPLGFGDRGDLRHFQGLLRILFNGLVLTGTTRR